MNNEALGEFALKLVGAFFSGTVVPKTLLDQLVARPGEGDPGIRKLVDEALARGNKARAAGGKTPIDASTPFLLSRGFGDAVAEDEVRHYLPEEKILINQTIFRDKLDGLDFAALDAARERALIEELQRESIGFSRDDTLIYFNMLKIDFLARRGAKAAPPAQAAPATAAQLVELVEKQFSLDSDGLAKLNSGHQVDTRLVEEIVGAGMRTQRIVPRLLVPYLTPPSKFFEKFRELLGLVVEQRDGNMVEVMQHFGVYLLLNGAPQDQIAALGLSTPLESFVSDRIGRVRQIFFAAMLFAHSFSYVLFAQSFEIRAKYLQMPEDQRVKLRKLYEADDRLALLVNNAANVATRRIAEFGVEAREIQMVLKKFLAANRKLVTAADLFPREVP